MHSIFQSSLNRHIALTKIDLLFFTGTPMPQNSLDSSQAWKLLSSVAIGWDACNVGSFTCGAAWSRTADELNMDKSSIRCKLILVPISTCMVTSLFFLLCLFTIKVIWMTMTINKLYLMTKMIYKKMVIKIYSVRRLVLPTFSAPSWPSPSYQEWTTATCNQRQITECSSSTIELVMKYLVDFGGPEPKHGFPIEKMRLFITFQWIPWQEWPQMTTTLPFGRRSWLKARCTWRDWCATGCVMNLIVRLSQT